MVPWDFGYHLWMKVLFGNGRTFISVKHFSRGSGVNVEHVYTKSKQMPISANKLIKEQTNIQNSERAYCFIIIMSFTWSNIQGTESSNKKKN